MSPLALLVALVAVGPFDPPTPAETCGTGVLQLSLADVVRMGEVGQRVSQQRCGAYPGDVQLAWPAGRQTVVGRINLGNFSVAGDNVGLALNLVMVNDTWMRSYPRGMFAPQTNSLMYVPSLVLPQQWQENLEPVKNTLLIVGGAVIVEEVVRALVTHH